MRTPNCTRWESGTGVNEMETNETSALLRKMSALRADVLKQDWKDDKMFSMGGKGGYSYLSADKVKRNLAPLLVKAGLEMRMEFSELECRAAIGNMSQHWTVKLTVTMMDTDTYESIATVVYGEAGDSGDKGVSKAQTCAIKQWALSQFLIADGIDPDAQQADIGSVTGFYKKSAEEREEVVSKVLAQAVKPESKVKVQPEPKPEENPETKAKTKVKPVAEAPEADNTAAPKEEAESPKATFKPTGPQAKAIERIEKAWEERAKNQEVTPEEYNAMSMARASISSPAEAVAFIKKYKEYKVA